MAVTFDAKVSSTTDTGSGTSISNSTLTVGTGSNRALVAMFAIVNSTLPSGLTATWDNGGTNQAMTAITGAKFESSGLNTSVQFFGLVAPTSGNKTLQVSWSTTSAEAHLSAVSFTGVDQTGGATSFPHGTGVNATATSVSQSITSATNNMVVYGATERVATFTSTGGTTIDLDAGGGGVTALATAYDNGAATVTCTLAWNGASANYNFVGTDILASGGTTFPTGGPMYYMREVEQWLGRVLRPAGRLLFPGVVMNRNGRVLRPAAGYLMS